MWLSGRPFTQHVQGYAVHPQPWRKVPHHQQRGKPLYCYITNVFVSCTVMSSLGHLTAVLRRNPLRLWSKAKPKGPGQGNAPAVHRKVQVNPHTAASVVQGTQQAHGNCRLSCTGRISRSSLERFPFPQSHHPSLGVPPPTPSRFLLRQEVDQAISILCAIHRA